MALRPPTLQGRVHAMVRSVQIAHRDDHSTARLAAAYELSRGRIGSREEVRGHVAEDGVECAVTEGEHLAIAADAGCQAVQRVAIEVDADDGSDARREGVQVVPAIAADIEDAFRWRPDDLFKKDAVRLDALEALFRIWQYFFQLPVHPSS